MNLRNETKQILSESWKLYPHTFAKKASEGRWVPYKHLRYISALVGPAILAGNARFILTAPPRSGKSEFISNWLPTWYLHNFPHKRVILASYALDFAAKWGSQVKENLTQNRHITIPIKKDTKAKKNFETLERGGMLCAGVGGPITGRGADVFIIDDPIKNYQEAMSETIRERHKDWYNSVVRTRLEPNASILLLQTRWHADDLAGWLISEQKQKQLDKIDNRPWIVINMPAICESPDDILDRQIGDALCPERYDLDALAEIKSDLGGGLVWSALYQQRPTNLEGSVILREWIKYYDTRPKNFTEIAIFADLSFKETPTTDFTVVEAWGVSDNKIYLLDQIRARMDFPAQMNAIREMSSRYPQAYMKQIEEAANGAALIAMLKNEIMGLNPINPKTSKEARLAAVSPIYQSGNVYYPNPTIAPWVNENLNEILGFPSMTHDDTVDCASYGVSYFGKYTNSITRLEALGKW